MHAHDFLIDQGNKWHVVEAIVERLPQRELVPPLDLVEETVNTGDRLTLVVAAQDNDLLGEADLEREKEANDLATLLTSVDVVSEEQVTKAPAEDLILLVLLVLIGHLLEHMEQITVLTVDVAEDLNRCFELE